MASHSFVPPAGGVSYDWENDHTFVKVSADDTRGAFTLMEDNLKSTFRLGLHEHRSHAETFYILAGDVEFHIDGAWRTAGAGTTIHIPPGVPHALRLAEGKTARMLMLYQPAGFDQYLARLAAMSPAELADDALQQRLAAEYDIHNLAGVPD
jgi:quercetin dioxygenase-like cupin family protein